jgi:hypothetical protein
MREQRKNRDMLAGKRSVAAPTRTRGEITPRGSRNGRKRGFDGRGLRGNASRPANHSGLGR